MKKILILVTFLVLVWFLFLRPVKAHWEYPLAPDEPEQTSDNLPPSWNYKDFIITPKAKYRIKSVVLSKHSYWAGGEDDKLSPYDLALGWGPMSDGRMINDLEISQSGRWFEYRWKKDSRISPAEIMIHSSNNHIIPADPHILQTIKRIKKYDYIVLEGYLVDVQSKHENWRWNTSVSRTDNYGGSCELIWVTRCLITQIQ